VQDCSFISSLCICAAFERRFQRRLVTSLVYPRDAQGQPVYNPHGKYLVRLWLNGVARAVVVDDRLPVDAEGNLLCSHTDCPQFLELWVAVIEKAYMKLCGGYDFPGSNSGIDLFSLTGWIPERLFLPEHRDVSPRDFESPPPRAWERVLSADSYGDCLITVSTSKNISEREADRVGLVTGHAYAVLGVFDTKVGEKLLQLKNPWANKSWRGRYSASDAASWTNRLRAEVGYDPDEAARVDDGVFFISWDDVLRYFRNIYLSWNPMLFSCVSTTHSRWPLSNGKASNDNFSVGENPQYIISLPDKAIQARATIWILLSRHITRQEQEGEESNEYISLNVYRNNQDFPRIWYPRGNNCVFKGVYTNNPHILTRYDIEEPGDGALSIVLSQHNKTSSLNYTLNCYCTRDFRFGTAAPLPRKLEVPSAWTVETCGGAPGRGPFYSNPQFQVTVPAGGSRLQLSCAASRPGTFCNVARVVGGGRVGRLDNMCLDAGSYMANFAATGSADLAAGTYTMVPSTFAPGDVGPFVISCYSAVPLLVKEIPVEGLGMHKMIIRGSWSRKAGTAVGCPNHGASGVWG